MIRLCGILLLVLAVFAAAPAWAGNVTTQPPASGSAWTWTYPTSAGTNGYLLQTDGTGITSWVAAGGTPSLSSFTAATTTNSIDSANWAQTWKWGTLTTQTALSFTTSSLTSGTLLSLANTAAAATATGDVLSVTNASTGTGYSIYSAITGAANTGYAGYFNNTSTGGYALYVNGTIGAALVSGLAAPTTVAVNLAWPLAGAADAVGAPDYAWAAAPTTGLYYNTGIGFAVGGVTKGTVTSTGLNSMAIGATTASTAKFTTIAASGVVTLASSIAFPAARKGTFVCTSGGAIVVSNTNMLVTSNVIISTNTVGGTISTTPNISAITSGTSFTAKCATSDTSTYNYVILN